MSNPTWPAGLPQAFRTADYREQRQPNTIRSSTSVGPAIVRRRYTAAVTTMAGSLVLTDAQKASLRTFYEVTLADGALVFDWPSFMDRGATVSLRFTEPPAFSTTGDLWVAACKLEELP